MFTPIPLTIYLVSAAIVFTTYHAIPTALERMEARKHGFGSIPTSQAFTFFIRWCGNDHGVMAIVMGMIAFGVQPNHVMGWTICISQSLVAVISFLSWVTIRKASL